MQGEQNNQEFRTAQEFQDYLAKLAASNNGHVNAQHLLDIRLRVYHRIEKARRRPLLVYASKFIGSTDNHNLNIMDLSDVSGFTDLAQSVDSKTHRKIDVLLHSPGGQVDVAERIVDILRQRFDEVTFLIPHSAYSAATMLALSGNQIILHPSATLGPIDPQINGVPAKSIIRGFDEARTTIEHSGPEALPAYIPLIEKYTLDLLEICRDADQLARTLASNWLFRFMFLEDEAKLEAIERISKYFSDYETHLTHSRPITFKKLQEQAPELNVKEADEELRQLLWEAFVLLDGLFNASSLVKVYENRFGISWGKAVEQQVLAMPVPVPTPTPQN